MFGFLFKYPISDFANGQFVLLGSWPGWLLLLLIASSAAALAFLIRWRLPQAAPKLRSWRAVVVWLLQSLLLALLLTLLWEPALTVAQLASQQNIIAILLDDSRSMAIADSGADGKKTRESAAEDMLKNGMLSGLQKRFQTRIYRLDTGIRQTESSQGIQPAAAATHLNGALKQFATETSGLPIGAVILLSDGAENSGASGDAGGIDIDTLNALRGRRLPVHTIGFGKEETAHDSEIDGVHIPSRAMANSRIPAQISFHQRGFSGEKTTLLIRDGEKTLASREVTFGPDGDMQTETVFFDAGAAGAKNLQFQLAPLAGEQNLLNNSVALPLNVDDQKRRILYVEGEPRWEYKFIRRAEDDDTLVQVASMLRTTENKIYRQGISSPAELEDGFPSRAEDLFGYQAIILGSVEAGYFTPQQQDLIRQFVDRRGGGLLFLAGRNSLADGGWGVSSLSDLFPTTLPRGGNTFMRDPATAGITAAGADSPIMRLTDDPAKNAERWQKMTYMMDYQDPGVPKPGATVLAEMRGGRRVMPLLITENYGRGRTAILASSGTWRWQMAEPLGDPDHDLFWQQLLRWLVVDSPGQVTVSSPTHNLMDEGGIHISADVRDKTYLPAPDATVTARFIGPDGSSSVVNMTPVTNNPGIFETEWNASKPGSYMVEVTANRSTPASASTTAAGDPVQELGSDTMAFQRTNGVAENFHTEQNSGLLKNLSEQTGGRYWTAKDISRLPREISYSEAGISVRDTKDLWDMPIVFFVLFALLFAEWFLRRKWGVV